MENEAYGYKESCQTAAVLAACIDDANLEQPRIAVTLGSGCAGLPDLFPRDGALKVGADVLPHYPRVDREADGHLGQMQVRRIWEDRDETVLLVGARVHYYQRILRKVEDRFKRIRDPEVKRAAVGYYVAMCHQLGVLDIITTNAVGTLYPGSIPVGSVVRIDDHLMEGDDGFGVPEEPNWFHERGTVDPNYNYARDAYFYSQAALYSPEIGELARQIASGQGFELKDVVLNWRKGRGYENPAYARRLIAEGIAHTCGMSTAPEAIRARSIGFTNESIFGLQASANPGIPHRHFASLSVVTNPVSTSHNAAPNHGEVGVEVGNAEERVGDFILELVRRRVLQRLGSELNFEAVDI